MDYTFDVIFVKDKQLTSRIGSWFKGRDHDALLISHPSAVGTLYTCLEFVNGDVSVITAREAMRRFKVMLAKTEVFDEDIPRTLLNAAITDRLEYIEQHRKK